MNSMRHTEPDFWRNAAAGLLMMCGLVLIGDGVVRWAWAQSNNSIPAGGCVIFLGLIVLLGKKKTHRKDHRRSDSEPTHDETT